MSLALASIPDDVTRKVRSFKLSQSKTNCAIICKINAQSMAVEVEKEINDVSIDELPEELAPSEPRYVLLSYVLNHDDSRISYPYCLLFVSPRSSSPDHKMMYAGTMHHFIDVSQVTKVFEVQDLDDITDEWLQEEMHKKGY
uniref:Glia maturation factor beta n=2 Tax=Schistocephalus solidus TaxID=70667 RepID=A0A0X3PI89_SCHSO